MERELILTIKRPEDSLETEIECLKTMFPYFESFEAFKTCNEVLDIKRHRTIYTYLRLKLIFQGIQQYDHQFIISLN